MAYDNTKIRILGIDPGYDRCGVAIIETEQGKEKLIASDCIQTKRNDKETKRLLSIGTSLATFIKKYKPNEVAIEKLFFTNNQKTAILVAQSIGIIKYLAEEKGLPVFEYTPMEVKVAIGGHGRAEKEDVHGMVKKLLPLSDKKMLDDEVDAIAVGLTHRASRKSVGKKPL